MEQYIGLGIEMVLKPSSNISTDTRRVSGTVAQVSDNGPSLILTQATMTVNAMVTHYKSLTVRGQEIIHLMLITEKPPAQPAVLQKTATRPGPTAKNTTNGSRAINQSSFSKVTRGGKVSTTTTIVSRQRSEAGSSPRGHSKAERQPRQQKVASKHKERAAPSESGNESSFSLTSSKGGRRRRMSFGEVDMSAITDGDDFDFEASNATFNKEEIFAQMRLEDSVDPALRLHSHNKVKKNFEWYENVLDEEESKGNSSVINKSVTKPKLKKSTSTGGSTTVELTPIVKDGGSMAPQFRTDNNIIVPTANPLQMTSILQGLDETDIPTQSMVLETIGRAACYCALSVFSNWKRINTIRKPPVVVVLCGNGDNGVEGLVAARHLTNHNAKVVVAIPDATQSLSPDAAVHLAVLRKTGHRIVEGIPAVPTVDVIVDALQSYGMPGIPPMSSCKLIEWANKNSAPTISLGMPAGYNGLTGLPWDSQTRPHTRIQAKWTLALGLPLSGQSNRESVGGLLLADVGVTRRRVEQCGVTGYVPPFDGNFITRLACK